MNLLYNDNLSPKNTFDATGKSVKDFFWTVRYLEDENLSSINKGDDYVGFGGKNAVEMGGNGGFTYLPLIFLKSIILELFLKQLVFLNSQEEWIRGHKANEIYGKLVELSSADSNFIKEKYNDFKKEVKESSGIERYQVLDFEDFIEQNSKMVTDLKYGDGLYGEPVVIYPNRVFYEYIGSYIQKKYREKYN